ncbi:MAG: hypothetical protein GC181_04760 [Bacteroidetes bacterium]|nr:hypothetical protein [Bacteroidota bacterium]
MPSRESTTNNFMVRKYSYEVYPKSVSGSSSGNNQLVTPNCTEEAYHGAVIPDNVPGSHSF